MTRALSARIRSIVELLLRLAMAGLRSAGRTFSKLTRRAACYPRAAAFAVIAGITAVIAIVYIARTPSTDFGDFDDSLDCMARNIYHEARGEPLDAQIAIAKVVMNRVADRHFPDTVCGVIKQGGEWPRHACQFSWWCDGRSDAISDERAMAQIRDLAREVLRGRHGDPTDGALWYHAKTVSPDWRKEFDEGPTIGSHVFYRAR